jgi:hypothetical protein
MVNVSSSATNADMFPAPPLDNAVVTSTPSLSKLSAFPKVPDCWINGLIPTPTSSPSISAAPSSVANTSRATILPPVDPVSSILTRIASSSSAATIAPEI